MRAIQVQNWGQDPQFTSSAPTPPVPGADSDLVQVRILASALPGLVRSQASGNHYTVTGVKPPYIPGADGVGYRTDTNELVYFGSFQAGGGFAEVINLPKSACIPVPIPANATKEDKKKLAIKVAGVVNPGMSSWMAMQARIPDFEDLRTRPGGFNVLIIGATSMSGKIAAKFVRSLGANKIIGAARRQAEMDKLDLDATVLLKDPAIETDWSSAMNGIKIDLVFDYIYGDALLGLLNALPANPVRAEELSTCVVQIGSVGQLDMSLPGALLRSKNITLIGTGPGSWSMRQQQRAFPGLLKIITEHDLENVAPITMRRLEDVGEAWGDKKGRTVFVP